VIRTLVLLGLAAVLQAGQVPGRPQIIRPVTGTAVIAGSVVGDDADRTPLRRVTLTLVRAGSGDSRATSTDDKGRYLFSDLPAGIYTLNAAKGAYVPTSYGSTRIGLPGSPIPIADAQAFSAEPIVMMRGAVLTGRLATPALQGLRSVAVEAVQIKTVNGVRRPRSIVGGQSTVSTDSRGVYRIYGLAPGDYVIVARSLLERPAADGVRGATSEELRWATALVSGNPTTGTQPPAASADPPLGRTTADAPTYYPGTTDVAAAAVVTLQKGEERAGLDFGLEHVPTAQLVVTVSAGGQPASGVGVFRFLKNTSGTIDPRFTMSVSQTGAEGQLFMPAIAPGTYTLLARTLPSAKQVLWGSIDVTVNGEDRTDLQIFLEPAPAVSGRLVFEGATQVPESRTPFAPRVESTTMLGSPGMTATVDPDGTFRIAGATPGSTRLVVPVRATSPWAPKSAMLGGRDLLDESFEVRAGEDVSGLVVTLTDRPAALSGTLMDATGRPAPQFFVLVYSTNRAFWTPNSRRTRPVRAGVDGSYRLSGLPPGEYFLCALTEIDPEQQYDPAYLEQFVPASIKISIADGEKKVQDLRIR